MLGSAYYFAIKALNDTAWRRKAVRKIYSILKQSGVKGVMNLMSHHLSNDYLRWISLYDTLTPAIKRELLNKSMQFETKPLISILMPVYNAPLALLDQAIWSVRNQIYPHWELCIADDASTCPEVKTLLLSHAKSDPRIKIVFRADNGHISKASNSALEIASGEFVALLDHDDLLAEHALFWVADAINKKPNVALIYSDEDKLTVAGVRVDPFFKSDWNPFLFLGRNMISHLGVYKTHIVKEIGGFRTGFEGAQDYDLALRFVEQIKAEQIVHIPRILYHWRIVDGSTAKSLDEKPYALLAGVRAIEAHLERSNINAAVDVSSSCLYRVKYQLPKNVPAVSIVVVANSNVDSVRNCVSSILSLTNYSAFEILITSNDSRLIDSYNGSQIPFTRDHEVITVIGARTDNRAQLSKRAMEKSKGNVVVFIDAELEVASSDWLEEMVGLVIQPNVGVVGAKLIYSDNLLSDAGVILGGNKSLTFAHRLLPVGYNGYFGRAALVQCYSAVNGSCMAVLKERYNALGGFDEKESVAGGEDLDFCLKARRAGYMVVWTPHAELYWRVARKPSLLSERAKNFVISQWVDKEEGDSAYNPNLSLESGGFGLAWPPRVDSLR